MVKVVTLTLPQVTLLVVLVVLHGMVLAVEVLVDNHLVRIDTDKPTVLVVVVLQTVTQVETVNKAL